MPPIGQVRNNNHGEFRYGSAITRDLIVDQTAENLAEVFGPGVWAFNATEGLGAAAAAAETRWYLPGDLKRQYMVSDWKFISSAAGRYMGMQARASVPGAGNIGYYLLGLKNNDTVVLANVTGAGTTDLVTAAITALLNNEIFRLEAWIDTSYPGGLQNIVLNNVSKGRITNSPGAANYNLALVGDPCTLDIKVDGGAVQHISFASGDATVIANGGLGALTNAGLAAVINNQIVGARAWVPAAATFVAISTNTFGSSGSIDVDAATPPDANTTLAFPLLANSGTAVQLASSNNARLRGFSGLTGGRGGNTAQWVRSFSIAGV